MNNIVNLEGPRQSGRSHLAMLMVLRYEGPSLWIEPTEEQASRRYNRFAMMANDTDRVCRMSWPDDIDRTWHLDYGLIIVDNWEAFKLPVREEILVRFNRQQPDGVHRTMVVIR